MQYHNNFTFGNIKISQESKTFIIAEAGVSHFGSLKKAYKLVDLAKFAGADAVKFQAYITEELIDKKFKSWFKRYKSKEVNFDFSQLSEIYTISKFLFFAFSFALVIDISDISIPTSLAG